MEPHLADGKLQVAASGIIRSSFREGNSLTLGVAGGFAPGGPSRRWNQPPWRSSLSWDLFTLSTRGSISAEVGWEWAGPMWYFASGGSEHLKWWLILLLITFPDARRVGILYEHRACFMESTQKMFEWWMLVQSGELIEHIWLVDSYVLSAF